MTTIQEVVKCTPEDFILNKKQYLETLESYSAWDNIPLLNHDPVHYPDKTLVRFRGMIQDMYNPEIYLEGYEVLDSNGGSRVLPGKYKDVNRCSDNETINVDSDKNINGERQTLFVISIPGLNSWVIEKEKALSKVQINTSVSNDSQSENCLKRVLDTIENSEEDKIENDSSSSCDNFEKHCNINSDPSDKSQVIISDKVSLENILNSPIPSESTKACIVKIYDNFDEYKLNEVIDIVGFLSIDPSLVLLGDPDVCEDHAGNLPPSVVPRLHAICVRRVLHYNPLLDMSSNLDKADIPSRLIDDNLVNNDDTSVNVFKKAHEILHLALTQTLFGDELAAEYVIFHLLSRVFTRRDLTPLGTFPLNITNVPAEHNMKNTKPYLKHFYDLLRDLVPVSHYITLTIDEMNSGMFVPKKDYDTDRLVSGQLQLCKGTNLLIDEMKLAEGKLEQMGLVNFQALRTVIKEQSVKYDFRYYGMDFECDIPVLVLSETKSILELGHQMPLEIDEKIRDNFEDMLPAVLHYLNAHKDLIRCYLTLMKYSDFNIGKEVNERIRDDLIDILKEPGTTPEDLHAHMLLGRLYSLSRGLRELTLESWNAVKTLEKNRRLRIASVRRTRMEL